LFAIKGRYPHKSMHPASASDIHRHTGRWLWSDTLNPRFFSGLEVNYFCSEAVHFSPSEIHPHEHLGPVLAFCSSGPGMDCNNALLRSSCPERKCLNSMRSMDSLRSAIPPGSLQKGVASFFLQDVRNLQDKRVFHQQHQKEIPRLQPAFFFCTTWKRFRDVQEDSKESSLSRRTISFLKTWYIKDTLGGFLSLPWDLPYPAVSRQCAT